MASPPPFDQPDQLVDRYEALARNMAVAITGKSDVIDLVLLGLIAEGHILVEDVPGVGKTTLAKALARSIDGQYGRIQFTPDLLPTDVIGVNVWNRSTNTFEFRPGPTFANIVLADEINRASPKTQSALLEAMAERQVTIDGTTRHLPPPFLVIATQNPIENEGTYPLPESQLDRFLLKVSIGYPNREAEQAILAGHSDHDPLDDLGPVVTATEVNAMASAARQTHVATPIQRYLVDLADASRNHPHLAVGMSPRATLALQRVARARAATRNRSYVTPDDVKLLAPYVIAHRLLLSPAARMAQVSTAEVVAEVLDAVPQPRADPALHRG